MVETTRRPPGRQNAKRCPGPGGSVFSQNQSSLNDARLAIVEGRQQQKLFSPPDTDIELLREENRRIDRLNAGMRRLCGLGKRATVEFILDYALCGGGLDLLEQRLERYNARLTADNLSVSGGDRFAPVPVYVIRGHR